jgi:hypothetical protein
MNFADLMPGDYQQKSITYQVTQSSGKSDVWLTFDKNLAAVGAFTGAKGGIWGDGGMGRYGHFRVLDNDGHQLFVSNNLAHPEDPESKAVCAVDKYGHGGSSDRPTAESGKPGDTIDYCGVPYAIKLASNLNSGSSRHFTIEFGYTGRQVEQGQNFDGGTVPFDVVATQAGHGPNDPSF